MLAHAILGTDDDHRHRALPNERLGHVTQWSSTQHFFQRRHLLAARTDRQALGPVNAHEMEDGRLDGACLKFNRNGSLG